MGDATIVIRTIDRGLSVKDCSAEILKGSSEKNGKTKFALR